MKKGSVQFKKSTANRARRSLLRKLAFKKSHSRRIVLKAEGKPFVSVVRQYKHSRQKRTVMKNIPLLFEMLANHDNVIAFFNELLSLRNDRKLKSVELDFRNIVAIDSSAICMLLSVIKELKNHNINVTGNYPEDMSCRKILIESGFLKHMKDANGRDINVEFPNFISETGTNKTRNKDISSVVRRSIGFLTGTESRFQPAYTVAMEICSNSVEHAYVHVRHKHWLFSVFKKENCVAYTMTDTGIGILKTLHKKFQDEIKDLFRSESAVLYRAFQRKYGSSTQQVNRNKGLPCVLDRFEKGLIKNLKVITNDVYLDFNCPNKEIPMSHELSGVLFYWEIDADCLTKLNNIS